MLKRKARPVSVANFRLELDLIMSNPEADEHFTHYQRRSHNLEGYLFLKQVKKLKSPELNDAEKAAAIVDMYKNFICLESPHELNIDRVTRSDIEKVLVTSHQLEKTNELCVSVDVFHPVESLLTREVREDSLARYVRSEDFFEFVRQKGEEFLHQIAVGTNLGNKIECVFRTNDFEDTKITDKDIAFVLKLHEDSPDWVPVRVTKISDVKEKEHYAYISKTSYCVGDSLEGFHLGKCTGYLPFSAEHALQSVTWLPTSKQYDRSQVLTEHVQYDPISENNPYATLYSYYQGDLRLPFHKIRHAVHLSTVVYDSVRKVYIRVSKTTTKYNDEIRQKVFKTKAQEKMVTTLYHSSFCFYKISETQCRYVHAVYIDPKIKIGLPLFRIIVKKRDAGINAGFMAVCKETEKNGFNRREDDLMLRSLDEYMEKYLPNKDSIKTWEI